jgi:catechol 2,3-dioxygenase-like lactoylglutathione lyase family enzyme
MAVKLNHTIDIQVANEVTLAADLGRRSKGEINRHDGGRGVYFEDPGGNLLEIITRPYGSGSTA